MTEPMHLSLAAHTARPIRRPLCWVRRDLAALKRHQRLLLIELAQLIGLAEERIAPWMRKP